MRRTKLLFSSILATVLGMGVIGGVVATKNTETKPVEVVEAATKPSTVSTIGLRLNGSYWGSAGAYYTAHVWGGSGSTTWPGVAFDDNNQVSGGGKVIYADVSAYTGFTHIIIVRWNNDQHTDEANRWSYYDGNSFSANSYNFFDNNDWGSCSSSKDYLNGYYLIGNFSSSSWDMANAKAADSSTVSGNVASWSSVSLAANDQFKVCYYNMGGTYDYQNNGFDGRHANFTWTTPYASNNVKCTAAGTYKIFLTSSYKVAANKDVTITYYERRNSSTSSAKTTTGNTDIALSTTLSGKFPSYTGYSIKEYRSGSYTGTVITLESTYPTADMSVYAIYQIQTFNIKYYRNNGAQQEVSYTQTKNYGQSVNILYPGAPAMSDASWDPSSFKYFVHWNTERNDSGATYTKMQPYSTNAALTLYYIEDWYGYRYSIDGGSNWIDLVHNDAGKGEGVMVQFAPATAQVLPLHSFITFQYYDGSIWRNLTSNVTFEGNYNTTTGIQLETNDTIYLKILDGGTYSCWVPGISDRTICVFDSSSATSGGTPYTMKGAGDNQTVTTMDVVIEKSQYVRRGYDGNYTYGTYYAGGTGDAALCFQQYGDNVAVQCLKTGVYTVYNKAGTHGSWADVWFTRNEPESAKYLARKFNTIISAICTDIVGGSKTLSNLQAAWGSNSSSELYKHFNGQITATMDYFKTTATTSDTDILACVARYDYIIRKYGTTALPDFLSRNNGYSASGQGAIRIALFGKTADSTNTVLVVTIISTLTIVGVGGYFLLRRKKQK